MDGKKKINRADFFKFGFGRGKKEVVKHIKKKVKKIGVRPPGAISEEQFLIKCTRCNDCVNACPHNAIFKPSFTSVGIYGDTPFLDLKHQACFYCEDFPCITSCKSGALIQESDLLKIGIAKFDDQHCLVSQGQYCDYCAKSCPSGIDALKIGNDRKPIIDESKCVGCGKCEYICVSQTDKALEIQWTV